MFVTVSRKKVQIDPGSFEALFESSNRREMAPIRQALIKGSISLSQLIYQAQKAEIPLPLFFAPKAFVEEQIKHKTDTLLDAMPDHSFSMNGRDRIDIRDIQLIVRDLLRKQKWAIKLDPGVKRNGLIGVFKNTNRSIEQQADELRNRLGFDLDEFRASTRKEQALEYFIRQVEGQQILIAQSQQNHMPQDLDKLNLSGLSVKNTKLPYIFLGSGPEDGGNQPAGRRIYTLAFLLALLAHGRFAAVTFNASIDPTENVFFFDLAGEFLVPRADLQHRSLSDIDQVESLASDFKITPTALVVRAARSGVLTQAESADLLDELRMSWKQRRGGRSPSDHVKAHMKYTGLEASRRFVDGLNTGKLSSAEFRKIVFLNKLGADRIPEFTRRVT